jgi:hypothetical protein
MRKCRSCGAEIDSNLMVCPSCHSLLDAPNAPMTPFAVPSRAAPTEPERSAPPLAARPPRREGGPAPGAPVSPFVADLSRRLARLAQWEEAAQPLGVELPRLPEWAEEAARAATNPEPWAEVVRGIERLAQRRIVSAFEEWERKTKSRLTRLEAYAVDSRLEREQIDDALHAARIGDVGAALATSHQVDRVVALKERHLDQARDELERLVSFLKDLQVLGLGLPRDPTEVADALERELRAGRLAPLKQEVRSLRAQALDGLKSGLPRYVAEYGDHLLEERAHGLPTEREATALAQGARDVVQGRPEEGIRRLRVLRQDHGPARARAPRVPPR